jgi:hypothetical protein
MRFRKIIFFGHSKKMEHFDDVISIGYICNVSMLLGTTLKNTYVFDRTATPMWAVNQLIKNNFQDFMLKDNIKSKKLFTNTENMYAVDEKYYIRLIMKLPLSEERYQKFYNNISAAKDRFLEKLSSKGHVLFIRCKEPYSYKDDGDRILTPDHAKKYQQNESEYVKGFTKMIRNRYPDLKFSVLYLNGEKTTVNYENHIITIPEPKFSWKDPRVARKMTRHISKFRAFVDEAVMKIHPEFSEPKKMISSNMEI